MAEHDDLDRQLVAALTPQPVQLEDSGEGQVEERESHGPVSPPSADSEMSCSRYPDDIFGTHRCPELEKRCPNGFRRARSLAGGGDEARLGVSVLLHRPDPAIRAPRAEHSLPQHGPTSGFCRRDPLSSVDTPRWATDRSRLTRKEALLRTRISHAVGPDFPPPRSGGVSEEVLVQDAVGNLAARRERAHQALNCFRQRRKVRVDGCLDDGMRRVEVAMGELVTHAGDVDPWDLWLGVKEFRADSLDGFADLDQPEPDGIEHQAIIERPSLPVDKDC